MLTTVGGSPRHDTQSVRMQHTRTWHAHSPRAANAHTLVYPGDSLQKNMHTNSTHTSPYLELLDLLQREAPQGHGEQVVVTAVGAGILLLRFFALAFLLGLVGRAILGERLVLLGLERLNDHRLLLVVDDNVCGQKGTGEAVSRT